MKQPFVPTRNLVLIGGRGCGKSALARRAQRLNKHFTLLPLDALIRYEAGGLTIPAIVETQGWRQFRELEYRVVEKAAAFPSGALIDCGGGVVVDLDENGDEVFSERKVRALRRHGLLVYLQRDVAYLARRIHGDPDRPELSERASFREIMERRDPWYRQAAHYVLACGERSKRDLVRELLDWFAAACTGD